MMAVTELRSTEAIRAHAAPGIADLLAQRSREAGDRRAFLDASSDATTSWSQIATIAAGWEEAAPPRLIAVAVSAPATFAAYFVAALASGVPIAPLDPRATASETARVLERLRITDVLVDGGEPPGALAGQGANLWDATPSGPVLIERGTRSWSMSTGADVADAAVLLATSGTSGAAKVVPLTERQLLHVARAVASHHALDPTDRGYCPLPLFHVNAQVVGVLSTLVSGGSLVVDDRFHRSRFWKTVGEHDVTWLNLVPAIIALLADSSAPADVVRRVRFARSASAPLPESVRDRFEATTGIGVLETYGMTEAASQITANPLDPALRRRGSVGQPIGVSLRVVDERNERVRTGSVGAVEIAGDGVVDAYLDATLEPIEARSRDGWLATGDLGRLDGEGYLYLVGRSDEVINRGGEKLYPREIEEVLRRHPRVTGAAVVGRPHPVLGSEPVAFVTITDATSGDPLVAELLAQCTVALSRYKQPSEIVVVRALPAGPTGKVSHRRVVEQLLEGAIAREPGDARETRMVAAGEQRSTR